MKKTVLSIVLIFLIHLVFAAWSDDATVNNVVCNLGGEQAIPKTAVCQDGTFYIAWFSNDSGNYDVRAQYYDYNGNEQWAPNGMLISNHTQMTWLTQWDICCDSQNNLILSFQDIRNHDNPDIFVYKIGPDGSFIWGDDGIAITDDNIAHMVPTVAATSVDNIIVAWITEVGIGMQKLSPTGDLAVTPYFELVTDSLTFTHPQIVPVENDTFILKYYKDTGPAWAPTRHLHAMKYSGAFEAVWDNECNISTQGGISAWTQHLSISPDNEGGFAICWNDDRDSDNMSEIYVQWVHGDGSTSYGDGGVIASVNDFTQGFYPFVVANPADDNVMVFWNEMDGDQNNRGLSGQKFDQSGNRLWTEHGANLMTMGGDNPYPFGAQPITNDAMTLEVMLFYTINAPSPNTDYMKAMRINEDGELAWLNGSVFVCETPNDMVHPIVAKTNQQYVFATWEDSRNGTSDIFAQNLSFDGVPGPVTSPSGISGTVTLDGGEGAVEDVTITIGEDTYSPNGTGYYYILLDPGTYTIDFSLDSYESATLTDVLVTEGEINEGQNVTLTYISPSGIAGTVTLDGGEGAVEDVTIAIGEEAYNPDGNGDYYIQLDPGTYSIEFSLEGYESATLTDVLVTEGEINEGQDVTLVFHHSTGDTDIPAPEFGLSIYPNPFNPMTNIAWSIPVPGDVRIDIYDVKGRKIASTTRYNQPAGEGSYTLDAEGFGSGVYFVKICSGSNSTVRKAVLLK